MEIFVFIGIILILVVFVSGVSVLIGRKNRRLMFIFPGALTVLTGYFIVLTYTSDGWVALGNFIFAFSGSIATIIVWILILMYYLKTKPH